MLIVYQAIVAVLEHSSSGDFFCHFQVWQVRHGGRVAVIRDGESCRLLQPACKLRAVSLDLDTPEQEDETFEPARVYFLQGENLSLINPFMPINKR